MSVQSSSSLRATPLSRGSVTEDLRGRMSADLEDLMNGIHQVTEQAFESSKQELEAFYQKTSSLSLPTRDLERLVILLGVSHMRAKSEIGSQTKKLQEVFKKFTRITNQLFEAEKELRLSAERRLKALEIKHAQLQKTVRRADRRENHSDRSERIVVVPVMCQPLWFVRF